MQILCVSHSYPRYDGDVAGAFVERLMIALRERSHAVKVIAPSEKGRGSRDRRHGVSVSRVRYAPPRYETLAYSGTMHEAAKSPLGALWATRLILAQANAIGHIHRIAPVDIVHAHWWVPGGMSAWIARIMRNPKYVVTLHGTDVAILEQSWIGRMFARRVLRGAAAVTAVSSYLAERVAMFAGIDPKSILVQPMPVAVTALGRVSRGGDGVVAIGRLTEQKNIGMLLEAIARLKGQGVRAPLKIIGDGPLREMLERRAKGLDIVDTVTFVGAVPPDELALAVGDADVMVFPAQAEGLGLAAAEALMMGVPVIATTGGGGVTDIVPPTGPGRLVGPKDVAGMAKAIEGFLGNASARLLATEAGASLRKRLEPAAVARVFEDVYLQALGRPTARRT